MNSMASAPNPHSYSGSSAGSHAQQARDAVCAVLTQVIQLLDLLDQEKFVRNPVGQVHSGIGPHVRHCLDHFDAFLTATITGHLDFDHRERGTPVERELVAARAEARRLHAALSALDPGTLHRPLDLSAQVAENDAPIPMKTNALRELSYLLAHTIHHNALIGVMARTMGVTLPPRFGYAPSTLTHLNGSPACAH